VINVQEAEMKVTQNRINDMRAATEKATLPVEEVCLS
jgi:hypothetical protein